MKTRTPEADQLRALVVDDHGGVRMVLRRLLEQLDYQTMEAASGLEAVSAFGLVGTFDIVFVDVDMPGMDGFATLHKLRQMDPHVVVVVMSGRMDQERADRAISLGAAVLAKPFDRKDVEASIARGRNRTASA